MSVRRVGFALAVLAGLVGCGSLPVTAQKHTGVSEAIKGGVVPSAEPLDPKFFARRAVQARAPLAFSLMPEAQAGLRAMEQEAAGARASLVRELEGNPGLYVRLQRFPQMAWDDRLSVLRSVFDVECKVLGIAAPKLVISSTETKGPAYFDFDPAVPGTGRVILNPEAIAKEKNPWTSLLLLIHETRHSAQFQLAFAQPSARPGIRAYNPEGPLQLRKNNYRAAFLAQKALAKELNFSDFCSLNNEYDAFRFGNFVVGSLTRWQADTLDMGCFSSQFDDRGFPRINLIELNAQVGPDKLLDAFNIREQEQYRLIKERDAARLLN